MWARTLFLVADGASEELQIPGIKFLLQVLQDAEQIWPEPPFAGPTCAPSHGKPPLVLEVISRAFRRTEVVVQRQRLFVDGRRDLEGNLTTCVWPMKSTMPS